MKKHILLILYIIVNICHGQNSYKTIEKSGKKPDWLNGTDENYIITYGSGPTSEAAKEQCLANIRTNIANAIAIQVSSKTEIDISTKNGKSDENFKYKIVSQTANLPSLNGISINKAKDYYWEKLQDKGKNIIYGYHLKYPFSKGELQALIEEYETMDRENTLKIKQMSALIDSVTSFDRLEAAIVEMQALETRLIDDRKEKIQALLERLKPSSHPFQIRPVQNNAGELTFVIKNANGDNVRATQKPIFTSKCAKLKSYNTTDDTYTLAYEFDLCKYVDVPEFKLSYTVGDRKLEFIQPVDVNLNKVELTLSGEVTIKALSQNPVDVLESECELNLNSRYNYPFKIRTIQLKVDNEQPIVSGEIGQSVDKQGVFKVSFKYNKPLKKEAITHKNKTFPYISCLIQYTNLNTGKDGVVHLSNQRYSTDW